MDIKLILFLAVCVAYATADGHEGHEGMSSCVEGIMKCNDQYGHMDHNDMYTLQSYYDCVAYVDCSMDWDSQVNVKDPLMSQLQQHMDTVSHVEHGYSGAQTPKGVAVSVIIMGVAFLLTLLY